MANKRIRDLTSIDTLPDGALIPLDASSFSEAKAISESDLANAVSLVLVPPLVVNDPDAASDNTDAIDAALGKYVYSSSKKGILRLPRGLVYLARAVFITAEHSGLTIDGDGCILVNDTEFGSLPDQAIMVVGLTGDQPTAAITLS